MGRLVLHQEFANGQAAGATHTRTAVYDRSGLISQEINATFTVAGSGQAAYTTTATTDYSYHEDSAWRGVVTGVTTSAWATSGPQPKSTSTIYKYVWRDQAQQARIIYDSDTSLDQLGAGLA